MVGKVAARDRSPAVSGFLHQSRFEVGDKSDSMVPLVSSLDAPARCVTEQWALHASELRGRGEGKRVGRLGYEISWAEGTVGFLLF